MALILVGVEIWDSRFAFRPFKGRNPDVRRLFPPICTVFISLRHTACTAALIQLLSYSNDCGLRHDIALSYSPQRSSLRYLLPLFHLPSSLCLPCDLTRPPLSTVFLTITTTLMGPRRAHPGLPPRPPPRPPSARVAGGLRRPSRFVEPPTQPTPTPPRSRPSHSSPSLPPQRPSPVRPLPTPSPAQRSPVSDIEISSLGVPSPAHDEGQHDAARHRRALQRRASRRRRRNESSDNDRHSDRYELRRRPRRSLRYIMRRRRRGERTMTTKTTAMTATITTAMRRWTWPPAPPRRGSTMPKRSIRITGRQRRRKLQPSTSTQMSRCPGCWRQ